MKNILFYKFKKLEELEETKQKLKGAAEALELKGTILIAEEGINGCVSGEEKEIEKYKQFLVKKLGEIEFKEGKTDKHTFKKMKVKIRKEIITFKQELDMSNKADYIEPEELKKILDNNEEVVIVDTRNTYESKIGKFKGAITPEMNIFTEFPEKLKELEEHKEKLIVTYCTGGIRCEKAATYMKEQGFKNVKQLHGGIIKYGENYGNKHWEGKCFVFDTRGAIDLDPELEGKDITKCEQCNLPTSTYHNCGLVSCDRLAILCDQCFENLEKTCSKKCRGEARLHPEKFTAEQRETACQLI